MEDLDYLKLTLNNCSWDCRAEEDQDLIDKVNVLNLKDTRFKFNLNESFKNHSIGRL